MTFHDKTKKPKLNSPVIAWQRGDYRIVARDEIDDEDGERFQMLVPEERMFDHMDEPAWLPVPHEDSTCEFLFTMMHEIVASVEVLPLWVRDFVDEHMEMEADEDLGGGGGKGGGVGASS